VKEGGRALIRCKAEWETQRTVWLSWPHNVENWGERLPALRAFYKEFISLVTQYQDIDLLVNTESEKRDLEIEFSKTDNTYSIRLHVLKTDDIWIRDYGPLFLESGCETAGVNFQFNGWGEKFPPWDNDNAIANKILQKYNYKQIESDFVFEGGNFESNGENVMLTVEECFFASNRNPGLNKIDFEHWSREHLGIEKVLWLPYGLKCDHTDGHVDNIARFISKDSILLYLPERGDPEYERMQLNVKYLNDNSKFTIVPCPYMFPMDFEGELLPSGYCNFIIINNAVVIPSYGNTIDSDVLQFFTSIFPKRNVHSMCIKDLIVEGGGLHCITRNE